MITMDYRFKPILTWPRPFTKSRRSSPFKAKYNATLDLLDRELHALSARNIVIQTYMAESDIRIDGLPRANTREPKR
ncbi:MAG: hypothetical protein L0229_22460 [Blastocatellia bacterium]|nr:hypothetical protein [Blastocatellia bacterium]